MDNTHTVGLVKENKIPFFGIMIFLVLYALYLKDVIGQEFVDMVAISDSISSTYYLIGMCVITLMIGLSHHGVYKSNNATRAYFIMCAVIAIIAFIHMFSVKVGSREVYIGIVCWFSCFLSFYYIGFSKRVEQFWLFLYIFFAYLVYEYLTTFYSVGAITSRYFTMNSSYMLLALFPLLMLLSNRKIQIVITLVIVYCLLFSNKRGGAVAALIGILTYFIIEFLPRGQKKGNRLLSVLSFFIIIYALWFFIQSILSLDNVVLVDRFISIEGDDGSGRFVIWTDILNKFLSSDIFQKLFGHGYDAVKLYSIEHMSAHNDYLEVLFDFGIIGFIAYLFFIIAMFRYAWSLIKMNSPLASSFSSSVVLFAVLSFMSHVLIYPAYMLLYSMYWGYAFGYEKKIKTRRINNL